VRGRWGALGAWSLYLVLVVVLAPVLVPSAAGRLAIVDPLNALAVAAFAISATPAQAKKQRVQGDEPDRANSKTKTQSLDSGVAPWKGSMEIDATRRAVEVTDVGPERGIVSGLDGFLIDPGNPREILAPTGNIGNSVFKSTDGGKNWHPANVGLTSFGQPVGVLNIRRDPSHPRTVYAVSFDGLFRSTDFGEHWNQLSDAAPLNDIAVSPTAPSVLFAVSVDHFFYKSTDGGATLVPQTGIGLPDLDFKLGIIPIFTNVVFTPSDPQTMYVVDERHGVYKSTDGGASFTRLSASPFSPGQVFPHPTQQDTIFVEAFTGTTGLFRSTDGGASFTEVTGGLPAGVVQFVTFDPADPSTLYAASTGGYCARPTAG